MTNLSGTLLRGGSLGLAAVATFAVVALLSSVAASARPRLGHRGAERRKALEQGGLFAIAEPLLRYMAGVISLFPLSGLRRRQEVDLRRADYCLGLTADEISALSVLAAVTLGPIIAGLAYLAGSSPVLGVPAATFGLILPMLQIQEVIRKRAKAISRSLPHAIEIAAMCMGAGLDFPGSLRLLSGRGRGKTDILAREFSLILEELELGRTRREALVNFAERVPTQAVRDFVNAVVQAEQKGNPLAQVLQVQGRMLNQRRSVAAEEAAARAGVLLIVPLVCLVACIMLLLMGPFIVKGVGF